MGKRGTKPSPTNLKLVKGTLRPSRQVKNEAKTILMDRLPSPPDSLHEKGREEWTLQIRELDKMGLLSNCDLTMFAMYCDAVGMYNEAKEILKREGAVRMTEKGGLIENPYCYLVERYRKASLSLATQFGFTPSSRTGISTNKIEANDPIDELLRKANGG
jgi:P27 family predicted phage terminase small subunit